jgi:hypothetical protein
MIKAAPDPLEITSATHPAHGWTTPSPRPTRSRPPGQSWSAAIAEAMVRSLFQRSFAKLFPLAVSRL